VHLVFDIFQGIGIAAAVGIRPFLPALAVGALGAADAQIDFAHSSYSFLEQAPFLLVMVMGVVVLGATERRATRDLLKGQFVTYALALVSMILGALLFAGALAQDRHAVWPGFIAGVLCAGVGLAATRPLLERVRSRLDDQTAGMLPLFSESGALLAAVLSVLLPPVGIVVLLLLLWLLFAGRGRSEQKYAGLRILR
jgi:positive regulator of sigma E activity